MMDILFQVYKDPNAQVRLTRNDIKAFFLVSFFSSHLIVIRKMFNQHPTSYSAKKGGKI